MLKFTLLLAFALSALLAACGGEDPPTPAATPKPPVTPVVIGSTPIPAPTPTAAPRAIPAPTPTGPRSAIEFVMQDRYSLGEAIEIKIRNNGGQSYLYQVSYPACFDLKFYDDSGKARQVESFGRIVELPPGEFIIPQGTHCDLIGESRIGPGEEVALLTWRQHECVIDNWGCVQSIQVNPGRYRIVGEFSPVGGDAKTVAERSFVIAGVGGDPPPPCQDPNLEISVKGDALQFRPNRLQVAAGSEVVLCFSNESRLGQHNWVMVQDGTKDNVAQRGLGAGPDSDYVQPEDPDVIAHTRLVNPGERGEVRFTAPPAGAYQFVCTFPGHNFTMIGEFVVTP